MLDRCSDPEPARPGTPRDATPEPACPAVASLSFIGTFPEEPDQAVIVLRGEIDAATVVRLGAHVEDLLAVHTRFLTIEAGAVQGYEAGLLDLLGVVQHRLGTRRGLLTVRGLHPCRPAAATPHAREPASDDPPDPVVSATE